MVFRECLDYIIRKNQIARPIFLSFLDFFRIKKSELMENSFFFTLLQRKTPIWILKSGLLKDIFKKITGCASKE